MTQETMYRKELINKRASEIITELQSIGISGIHKFANRLKIAADTEEYLDILAQGRFALMLIHSGFSGINMEPLRSGPDIMMTSEECTAYWEIRRRRPNEGDYGFAKSRDASQISPDRDENVIDIIRNKLSQLCDGEINIVVIWSNTVKVGLPEIQEACKSISKEILENEGTYAKLSGIILIQDEKIDFTLPDKTYLFINNKAIPQLPESLDRKLSSSCKLRYTIQHFLECP